MLRRTIALVSLAVVSLASVAFAQTERDLDVKTFRLRNLKPEDAAKLLGPYVTSPGGGVFEAGSIGAITVRETPLLLVRIDSLLKLHDRPRASVSMRFQLIAALDSARKDPSIAAIDAELRKLFKFGGYELIGEATMLTEEMNDFATTLSTKPRNVGGNYLNESFQIRGWMEALAGSGADRTLRLTISLQDLNGAKGGADLLRTGLTIPVGQSVILGSARPTMMIGSRVALILVVQPEVK